MDRRTTLKWVLAASAAWQGFAVRGAEQGSTTPASATPLPAHGYGTDPDLIRIYKGGELWPLTFSTAERRTAGVLADIIIPADEHSPGASAAGVVDFIDEWISAPYPGHDENRRTVLDGFKWLDEESQRRFGSNFADLPADRQREICDAICSVARAAPPLAAAARFFAFFRDLTAGGFYTTPLGRQDLQYVGNVAMARFDGPPQDLLQRLGLAP